MRTYPNGSNQTLPNLFLQETHKYEQDRLLHLVTIEVSGETPLYFVDSNHDVKYNNITYVAFPLQYSSPNVASDGSLQKASLTAANVSRDMSYYLETYNGLRGSRVTVITVYEKFLDETYVIKRNVGEYLSTKQYFIGDTVHLTEDGNYYAALSETVGDLIVEGSLSNATFTRATVVYSRETGAQVDSGVPRYERGRTQSLLQAGTTNLLVNSGFENDWTSWAFGIGTGITATRTIVNSPVKSGVKAAKVEITASTSVSDASLKQTFSAAESVTLTLSAEILEVSGNVHSRLAIQCYNGTTYRYITSARATSPCRISVTDTIPTGYWLHNLWLETNPLNIGDTGYVVVDEFQCELKFAATPFVDGTRADLYSNTSDKAIFIEEATINLYADGDYASGSLHPVKSASNWSIIADPTGRWSGNVAKFTANNAAAYMGRDIAITVGLAYTYSVWCYVSLDFVAGTPVCLVGEQGFGGNMAQYNLSAKGTWQYLTYTRTSATTTNGRVLAYPGYASGGALPSAGYVLFKNLQVEQKAYSTSFHTGTRNNETLTISTSGRLSAAEGTIECWVYVSGLLLTGSAGQGLFTINYGAANSICLYKDNGGSYGSWKAKITDASDTGRQAAWTPSSPLSTGWHHFAMTYSTAAIRLYVDSVLKSELLNPASLPSTLGATALIGSLLSGAGQINSLIDDLRIYPTARTQEEILASYNSTSSQPVTKLNHYVCRFDNNLQITKGVINTSKYKVTNEDDLIVSSTNPNVDTTQNIEDEFIVDSYSAEAKTVTLNLEPIVDLEVSLPRRRLTPYACYWKYKSAECGYSGGLVTCRKDLTDCVAHNNSIRFGGFPGIPNQSIRRIIL